MKNPENDVVINYSEQIIKNGLLEDRDTITYYMECLKFLYSFLSDPKYNAIKKGEMYEKFKSLCDWLDSPPVENSKSALDIGIDVHLFGVIGKSLFFLKDQSSSQFNNELLRLFDINQARGNVWLFHMAGLLAKNGIKIEFIPERNKKTPDFSAELNGRKTYFEANARSRPCKTIEELDKLLWDVLHGDKKSGKQLKFQDTRFNPGIIVLDISNSDYNANSSGMIPVVSLQKAAIVYEDEKGRKVYDINQDKTFLNREENKGNVVASALETFQLLDKSKYNVRGLLVGTSMLIVVAGDRISSPKGGIMFLERSCYQEAFLELAPLIYLV